MSRVKIPISRYLPMLERRCFYRWHHGELTRQVSPNDAPHAGNGAMFGEMVKT